jgi:hypothetical protein
MSSKGYSWHPSNKNFPKITTLLNHGLKIKKPITGLLAPRPGLEPGT